MPVAALERSTMKTSAPVLIVYAPARTCSAALSPRSSFSSRRSPRHSEAKQLCVLTRCRLERDKTQVALASPVLPYRFSHISRVVRPPTNFVCTVIDCIQSFTLMPHAPGGICLQRDCETTTASPSKRDVALSHPRNPMA